MAADQIVPLDTSGVYLLAFAYSLMDDCKKAIPILRKNLQNEQKTSVWSDQQRLLDRSNFLLARCYANQGEVEESLIILEAFSNDPARYKDKIKDSLDLQRFPEFRSLRVNKRWDEYRKKAESLVNK